MSASTTPNNLTNDQELAIRDFYDIVVADETLWGGLAAQRKTVGQACLDLMGYQVTPYGEIVPKGTQVTMRFGETPNLNPLNVLYQTDGDKVRRAVGEEDANNGADEASTSESSESN